MTTEPKPALFEPPHPPTHPRRSDLVKRVVRSWTSWIHGLYDKSFTMMMGEIKMPGLHLFIANQLELMDEVMYKAKEYPKHRYMVEVLEPAIGISTFNANGEDWEQQREMINPAFAHTALAKTLALMCDAAQDVVEHIWHLREQHGDVIDVDPLMTHVAADIIFRTIFSQPLDMTGSGEIYRRFNKFQKYSHYGSMLRLYKLPSMGFKRLADREAKAIQAVFAGVIEDRYRAFHERGEIVHHDILQSLFEAKHPVTGEPFTCQRVMEQIALIFLAGHETSASLMSWACYLLAECQHIQDAIREETERLTHGGKLTMDALKGMAMTRNVVRETLRLYPPVPFLPREPVCPVTMREKQIEPGDMLVVSPWLIQRSEHHWPCPHAFDPDRFETEAGQDMLKKAWIPFGKGPRLCIGAGFAQQEAMVVLSTLVRNYRIEALPDDKPEPIARLTIRPKDGIRLKLTPVAA